MSNVIRFLETLGSRPTPSMTEYGVLVSGIDASEDQRRALLNQDHIALNRLLDGRSEMICMVWKQPDEEPVRREEDQPEPETPSEDAPPEKE